MNLTTIRQTFLAIALATMPVIVSAAETDTSGSPTNDMLLLDSMGRVVRVPTNEVPSELQPPANVGLDRQFPNPTKGATMPPELLERISKGTNEFQFFSAAPPPLMPYLASQDEYGNTAIRPDALFFFVPLEGPVQGSKYWLSEYGFRYSLQQTITFVSMTGVKQGDSELGYYTLDLKAKWNIYNAPTDGNAGWISSQVEDKTGFETNSSTQSAKSNLGTVTDPTGIWSDVNGLRVPELAWQESLRHGEIVVVAGMVSQRNYIDGNAYADSGRSEFINSALIHSLVLPLAQYNYGFNLQWQPVDEWYAMVGGSMGGNSAGNAPWVDYNSENWSLPVEIGYAPQDFLGFGPGVYRIQPFLAGAEVGTNSTSGGGLCFDLQQQLGADSSFGWFGRYGFGNSKVTGGAAEQAGTGFVFKGPFDHLLLDRKSNDFLGVGFVWSEPSYTTKTIYHENEYGLEAVYALQLTPTIKIQPDFQMIWDPTFNKEHDEATVFQLQLVMSW
jgi:carbohydrate-selective porin OprB